MAICIPNPQWWVRVLVRDMLRQYLSIFIIVMPFLLFFWLVEATMTPIINCSCQSTTKGVNNALMWVFLFEPPIGGGRLSTMGWMVPNFGKGGSVGDSGFLVGLYYRL